MKVKSRVPYLSTAFVAALFVCGAATMATAAEDFPTLVKRLQQEKPQFAKRHQTLLAERYDLATAPPRASPCPAASSYKRAYA